MACAHSAAAVSATISAAATTSAARAVVSFGTSRLASVAPSLSSCQSLVAARVPFVAYSPLGAAQPARRFLMGAKASAATFEGKIFHDFEVEDIKGNKVPLADYKGKVALVVNVASQCGLTDSNYKELTALYEKYKDQGFVVLAFPSNQFGAQEPGSNAQIENFACSRYKATFPLFSKVDVNGPNTAPVYQFLKSQKGGGILGDDIKWNFGKFLVDKNGKVVQRYAPTTGPSSIEGDIKKLL